MTTYQPFPLQVSEDTDIAAFLRNPFVTDEQVLNFLGAIANFAETKVCQAASRLRVARKHPPDVPALLAAYWACDQRLHTDGRPDVPASLVAYWTVKGSSAASASDLQACELLDACTDSIVRQRLDQYTRDRIIIAFSRIEDGLKDAGRRYGEIQAKRRLGKPTADPDDRARNDRIRKRHAALVAEQGKSGATSQTATEFGLSTRTIRRLIQR